MPLSSTMISILLNVVFFMLIDMIPVFWGNAYGSGTYGSKDGFGTSEKSNDPYATHGQLSYRNRTK